MHQCPKKISLPKIIMNTETKIIQREISKEYAYRKDDSKNVQSFILENLDPEVLKPWHENWKWVFVHAYEFWIHELGKIVVSFKLFSFFFSTVK